MGKDGPEIVPLGMELPSAESYRHSSSYAGFVSRAIALILDLLILTIVLALSSFLGNLVIDMLGFTRATARLVQALVVSLNVALPVAYFIFFWALAGQTPGKGFMGIEVVRLDRRELTIRRAALRLLGYAASSFLLLGFLWVLIDPRRQALHDKLAGTVVLYVGRDALPASATELEAEDAPVD